MGYKILFFTILFFAVFFIGCSDDEVKTYSDFDFGDMKIIEDSGIVLEFSDPTNNQVISGFNDLTIHVVASKSYPSSDFSYLYPITDSTVEFGSLFPRKYIGSTIETNHVISYSTYKRRNGAHILRPWLELLIGGEQHYVLGKEIVVMVSNNFLEVTNFSDPTGDWHGLEGDLFMPIDAGMDGTYLDGLHDITNVVVATSGPNMKLTFSVSNLSTAWNPFNGFDHVSYHIYLDDPNKTGATVMPKQQSSLPAGIDDWDYLIMVDGWTKNIYSSVDSSASAFGTGTGAPEVSVDSLRNEVSFIAFADSLGNPATLSNWTIYVTLFDVDGTSGAMRPVALDGTGHVIRSTNAAMFPAFVYVGALIMDWVEPFIIKY